MRADSATIQEAGVNDALALAATSEGARLCALGYHAWTPWVQLPNTSFVTICARVGCNHEEQYDL